jgi:hypothetical protein
MPTLAVQTQLSASTPSSTSSVTIRDLEGRIESALERLRLTSDVTPQHDANALLKDLREFFAPASYQANVQLQEDGRKKRSTADASYWSFGKGEMLIYFESRSGETESPLSLATKTSEISGQIPPSGGTSASAGDDDEHGLSEEIRQCCDALDQAEKQGRQFISYKSFRDLTLPAFPYKWAKSPEERQRILGSAIEKGAIVSKRIPNPKSPLHPTATVSLNRTVNIQTKSRFNPVAVLGEPVSTTLLRDRG